MFKSLQSDSITLHLINEDNLEEVYSKVTLHSGSEFKNRIDNIVLAFTGMQSDLDAEKKSMERPRKKRGKEIERVIMSTSGMYGDLQGIVGASLPGIKSLELPSGEINEDELG